MSIQEKVELLSDILEVDVEDIELNKELDSYETWDSVAVLSVISAVNEQTGRYLHASEVLKLRTIADLILLFDKEG